MRSLDMPFCQVPSQAYVLKLYNGGWGVPADGISMVEPGTTRPAAGLVTLVHPATQVFQAGILQPVGGPLARVQWRVAGVPVPGATGSSFTYQARLGSS